MKVRIFQAQESDLDDLGRMSRDAAILTGVATGFFGFAVDVTKDLFLSSGAKTETIAFFAGVSAVSWVIAIVAGSMAVGKWIERGAQVRKIKEKVVFDDEVQTHRESL